MTEKYENKKNIITTAAEAKIRQLIEQARQDLLRLAMSVNHDKSVPFSFDNYPSLKAQADRIITNLSKNIKAQITTTTKEAWILSNKKNDALCDSILKDVSKSGNKEKVARYYTRNEDALTAFMQRSDNGLNLSERIWDITEQFYKEVELALSAGIADGTSADEMSRVVRSYLNEPNRLFRRVRDEYGVLQLSKAARQYHPGAGVYRSSYKNAMRLTRTETNISFRNADYTRWQGLDFVIGIRITLSGNHKVEDMCDKLQGDYPKDFRFTGWHPQCRCQVITILKDINEIREDNIKIMNGIAPTGESINKVRDTPPAFKEWLSDNSDRIANAASIPYFISENPKYVADYM